MKKMFILGVILLMPLAVSAKVTSDTKVIGAAAGDDVKQSVEDSINLNDYDEMKKATNGFYVEGLEISCVNGTRKLTVKNTTISNALVCANNNKNAYYEVISNGANNLKDGDSCNVDEGTLYATRIYKYDCDYLAGSTDDNKKPFSTTTTTTTTKATTTASSNKDTGTTDNKDTGVEDYFIVLGTIGIVVTAVLFVIDKKNVFKKI